MLAKTFRKHTADRKLMIEKEEAFFLPSIYSRCFEFKCQNFRVYRSVHGHKLRKRSLEIETHFCFVFEENREKRQNVLFILVFIYYLFIRIIYSRCRLLDRYCLKCWPLAATIRRLSVFFRLNIGALRYTRTTFEVSSQKSYVKTIIFSNISTLKFGTPSRIVSEWHKRNIHGPANFQKT